MGKWIYKSEGSGKCPHGWAAFCDECNAEIQVLKAEIDRLKEEAAISRATQQRLEVKMAAQRGLHGAFMDNAKTRARTWKMAAKEWSSEFKSSAICDRGADVDDVIFHNNLGQIREVKKAAPGWRDRVNPPKGEKG